jgi:hypothetical protein
MPKHTSADGARRLPLWHLGGFGPLTKLEPLTCGSSGFRPNGIRTRVHLESVLGADLAACEDSRIRFMTCGFDAGRSPVVP